MSAKIKNTVFEKHYISRNVVRIRTSCKTSAQTSRLLTSIYDTCTITDTSETARNEDSDYPMITFVRFNNRKMLLNLSVEDMRYIDGHVIDCGSLTHFTVPMAYDFIEKVAHYMKHDERFEKIQSIEIGNVVEQNNNESPRVWMRADRENENVVIYYWKFIPNVVYDFYDKCIKAGCILTDLMPYDPDIDYESLKGHIERKEFNYLFIEALLSKNTAIELNSRVLDLVCIAHDYEYYMKSNQRTGAYSNLEQISDNRYVCYVYVPSSVNDLEIVTNIIRTKE